MLPFTTFDVWSALGGDTSTPQSDDLGTITTFVAGMQQMKLALCSTFYRNTRVVDCVETRIPQAPSRLHEDVDIRDIHFEKQREVRYGKGSRH